MKINKDNIIGFIVGIIVLVVIFWGIGITKRLADVERAHNALVAALTQQARPQQNMQRPPMANSPATDAVKDLIPQVPKK